MLDFLYLALVVAPLTIAAAALLLVALRGYRGHALAGAERRRLELERPQEPPAGLRPSLEELSALVEALAHPPRPVPLPGAGGDASRAVPRVGAPAAPTKHCPDCAEEVLAAARVCKHCRYRFDERDARRISA